MSTPDRRSDSQNATRDELLAEKRQLEAAKLQNDRDLNRLRSRADGKGGKRHDQELMQKQGEKAELDHRLGENRRQLDEAPEGVPAQRPGSEGPSQRIGGYREEELRYERGSPHRDYAEYKRIKEGERRAGVGEGARTADNPLDGVNSALHARDSNRYPATDPKMDEHFQSRHGAHPYTDAYPRSGSAYTPEQAEADREAAERADEERISTSRAHAGADGPRESSSESKQKGTEHRGKEDRDDHERER